MPPTFDFGSFPLLETERLVLRRLSPDDADGMHVLFGDPEVLRFLTRPPILSREEGEQSIAWFNNRLAQAEGVEWAITLPAEGGRFIGITGWGDWNRTDRRVDMGWAIQRQHWGRGYATEAARAVIAWCFGNLDVHRVTADCTDGNIASETVMRKCGFTHEGTFRESCWEHGRFVDIKYFGLLRSEWEALGR
jgi:ribosomal-protein-alanine N-acetyltransferase